MAQILIADDEIYVRDLIKRSLAHGPHSFLKPQTEMKQSEFWKSIPWIF